MQTRDKLFIDGRWIAPSSTQSIDVHNAGTGEVMGRIPAATDKDVDAATAVLTSVRAVLANPMTMAMWGLIVAGGLALGHGFDAVTQREFQDEVMARFAQITEVLVAQHAEIEALRRRVQALEHG